MHWADVEAEKIDSNSPLIATGEAPSGPIHLGHIREVLTGETIARVSDGELILIVDSLDPLRRSYPFLDDSYVDHIGKPLSEIPCTCGEHDNYAEHFMDPFLRSLEELDVEVKVKYAHEMYARGEYEEAIRSIIEDRDDVAKIIEEETGRELDEDWFPYNPICAGCEEIGNTVIKGFDDPYVEYECECGHEGKSDIRKAEGKLPWRCDWPARWWILGVDCEPFGKDLSASGGCWDTGKRIIEEIFDTEAPHPVVYEWIQLKGEGPMSSSSGVVIRTEEMLQMVSPEVLRYMIMDSKPKSHIDFDPGLGLLDLVDEYDQAEQVYFEEGDEDKARAYELSQVEEVPEKRPQRIPYRHLVNLIQIYDDSEKIWKVAQETGQIEEDKEEDYERFEERAENVEFWLENHAPDMVKFSLKEELPSVDLDEDEKTFLRSYSEGLDECEWKGEQLHQLVHEQAEKTGIDKGKAFRSFYKILLGEKRGPRLGRFLSQLEEGFVRERISEAVSS
ncbi:MAG: lysine--tRNA ligase [Candidatus Thermoplasmatota archaeon]